MILAIGGGPSKRLSFLSSSAVSEDYATASLQKLTHIHSQTGVVHGFLQRNVKVVANYSPENGITF